MLSLCASWPTAVVSGCADGTARLLRPSDGGLLASLPCGSPVTCVAVAHCHSTDGERRAASGALPVVLAACRDGSVRAFALSGGSPFAAACVAVYGPVGAVPDEDGGDIEGKKKPSGALTAGPAKALAAVAASPDGMRLAAAGWDGEVRIWDGRAAAAAAAGGFASSAAAAHAEAAAAVAASAASHGAGDAAGAAGAPSKRRRRAEAAAAAVAAAAAAPHEPLAPRAPISTLSGHSGCVASLCWPSPSTLVSGGWDHSVRIWDATTGSVSHRLNQGASKAVYCVDARLGFGGGEAAPLVAFCGAERAVRVWDPRTPGATTAAISLTSHASFVSAVAWCPWEEHRLLSCGHDGALKVWDVRAAMPLHTARPGATKGGKSGAAAKGGATVAGEPGAPDRLLAATWVRGTEAGGGAASRRVVTGGEAGVVHILGARPLVA